MRPHDSTVGADQHVGRKVDELERELSEAHLRETATAEILRVISHSKADVQPVFDTIVKSAVRLCDGLFSALFQFDGELIHLVAQHNWPPEALKEAHRILPAPPTQLIAGRAILRRAVVHIPDVELDLESHQRVLSRAIGWRSGLFVPLLQDAHPVGTIVVTRAEPGPFSDSEIELLKTFADQAVIAIENARLFEAEQASKRELQESLEYQTAISNVLGVISRSPTDVQPVFKTIAGSAAELCRAEFCAVFRFDGELVHFVASHGWPPESIEHTRRIYPIPPGRLSAAARSILSGSVEEIPDIYADPEYQHGFTGNYRSIVSVPMLKGSRSVGAICIARSETGCFPDRQIELLRTFADQAVIAIENTRLFEEVQARTRDLTESLEYQTAITDVLDVISRSPNELQPVLDTIVQTARRLCHSDRAQFFRLENGKYHLTAHQGTNPEFVTYLAENPISPGSGSGTTTGRAAHERRTIHAPDVLADLDFARGDRVGRGRSVLAVPLLRDNVAIGVITVAQSIVKPFSDRQIAVVETFANQALIAIENTRLFEAEQASKRELQESLEYQKATSEVLAVISRSKFDLKPVLDAIAKVASSLAADDVLIQLREGDYLRLAAHHGPGPIKINRPPLPIGRDWVSGRAVVDRRSIHVRDLASAGDEFSLGRDLAHQVGHRTTLAIPLLRENGAVGCLTLRRFEVRPFSDKEIAILQTFADQAVIAIENTRLFEEIAQKSRELEIASQHKSQFVANMSHELRTPLAAILGYAELMQEGFYEPQGPKSLDALTRIRSNGKHLLSLINTVLDIAKIESGQFSLNLAEYALSSVVETVRAATESLAETKKIALMTYVPKSLPIGFGDEQRLTQVLLNLVGNAIKFTDTGEVRITAKAENGHFAVSVADTGPGIPADQLTRVFEQFHQVDNSNTKKKGGTGLGLAIAKQIVEMHGGRVWVESEPSKGATFQMQLPVRAESRKALQ